LISYKLDEFGSVCNTEITDNSINDINDISGKIYKSNEIIKEYDLKKSKFYTTTAKLRGIINDNFDEMGCRIWNEASKSIIMQAYNGNYKFPDKPKKTRKSKVKKETLLEVTLTLEEYQKLVEAYGKEMVDFKIEAMNTWINKNPSKNYKRYYYAMVRWCEQELQQEQKQIKKQITYFIYYKFIYDGMTVDQGNISIDLDNPITRKDIRNIKIELQTEADNRPPEYLVQNGYPIIANIIKLE